MRGWAAAAIDIGTNSVLLTAARPAPKEGVHILEDRSVITRLGQGLGQEGSLTDEAIERTLAVLEEFGAAILALGATARAVGTSALRRAQNAAFFLEKAEAALGIPVEILTGFDEAKLGYKGALSGLTTLSIDDDPIMIDPGGGSTEVVSARGYSAQSLELGAVRLTEAFGLAPPASDPPPEEALSELSAYIRKKLLLLSPASGKPVVGVGGTATTLSALSLGLERYESSKVHGYELSRKEIRDISARLATLTLAQREKIPCLPPGRADIAVAGGVLLEELLRQLDVDSMTVSDRGLRYGLIDQIIDRW